jgi:hypothetical protein
MKNVVFSLIIASSLLLACKNRNKSSQQAAMATPAEVAETKSDLDKKMEDLQQLSPYTVPQMRALLPAELDGDSAIDAEAYTNMGTGYTRAMYHLSDSTSMEISIFDCGGVAGAGFYNAQFVNQLGNQSDNEKEYTKMIDFKGEKAIVHARKDKSFSSLMYTAAGRLLVTLEGKGIDADKLKDKAGELKFK